MVALQSALVVASVAIAAHYTGLWTLPKRSAPIIDSDETERFSCRPFLPNLFIESPPPVDHPLIKDASERLGTFLSKRFAQADIDSLSVAVITSAGAVFEKNYGIMRGNESDSSPPTHSHSSYRIASTGKLFTVLEGHILVQKGFMSWDDPITKYFPEFKYRPDGLSSSYQPSPMEEAPITLFQLASHMSGLGRDWPSGDVANWPKDLVGSGPPPINGLPFPENAALFDAITKHRLVFPPQSYPAYSNTGIGLLGLALVAANRAASKNPAEEPESYADLVKRDIFDPMGLNGSHFLTTEANKHLVVVPSLSPEAADEDFLDAMNGAGGQFSSLSDSVILVQTLLNPRHPKSVITPHTMNKWLQPVHTFEEDDWTESGLVWEIVKSQDSNGRLRKIYWKLGEMAGYHTAVAFHPGTSYGVAVLMGGNYPDAAKLAYDTFEIFQPAIDGALAELSSTLYAGQWTSQDEQSSAFISVDKGTLYIEHFVLNGTDVLAMFHAAGRLPLRSSMKRDEFRLDTGFPGPFFNAKRHMGCYPYWVGLDIWSLRNNVPLNHIHFEGDENQRVLYVPAADVVMTRL